MAWHMFHVKWRKIDIYTCMAEKVFLKLWEINKYIFLGAEWVARANRIVANVDRVPSPKCVHTVTANNSVLINTNFIIIQSVCVHLPGETLSTFLIFFYLKSKIYYFDLFLGLRQTVMKLFFFIFIVESTVLYFGHYIKIKYVFCKLVMLSKTLCNMMTHLFNEAYVVAN